MYTKEEASQLRQAFWTAFGKYISPKLSAEGFKINWTNYKTGFKHVYFRMNADHKSASISIEMTHTDIEIQQLFFEQFLAMKTLLHEYLGEEWDWQLHTSNEEGKTISYIKKEIHPVNIFNQNNWSEIISFFKPRIIALDQFWCDAKHQFEELK